VRSGRRTAFSACTPTLNGKRLALWMLLCVSVFVVCKTMGGCTGDVAPVQCIRTANPVTLNGMNRILGSTLYVVVRVASGLCLFVCALFECIFDKVLYSAYP
jgi:hypothetical protein